jgi:arabinose-5-phosphate isomerase
MNYIDSAKRTLTLEQEAINDGIELLTEDFNKACEIILTCTGRVIVTGIGKSGHIGKKISATLASTGTPSFFLHPAEANHGDLGMVTPKDTILALSQSGSSSEILSLLPLFKRQQNKLIAITGDAMSPLAQSSDAWLNTSVNKEACPLNLAPTSSTTLALVLGDALAIALLEQRGFTSEEFAFSHPGGALGKKLLVQVKDIMQKDPNIPSVTENCLLKDALLEMNSKGLGMTTVVNDTGQCIGIFTDGDLRREISKGSDIHLIKINTIMTTQFTCINHDALAAEALNLMEDKKISVVIARDKDLNVKGVLHLHDILQAGIT